jgi:hypothetical protein
MDRGLILLFVVLGALWVVRWGWACSQLQS